MISPRMDSDLKNEGKKVKDGQADYGPDEKKCRVTELVEGATRDHASDFGDRFIRANAASGIGWTKPKIAACFLDGTSESAVVDDLAADGFRSEERGEEGKGWPGRLWSR